MDSANNRKLRWARQFSFVTILRVIDEHDDPRRAMGAALKFKLLPWRKQTAQ